MSKGINKAIYITEYQNNWVHVFDTLEDAVDELYEVVDKKDLDTDYRYPGGRDADGNTFQIHRGTYYPQNHII